MGLFGSRRRGAAEGLRPAELWILLVLKAAGGACGEAKIMGILLLLDVVYGVTGAAFERGPWSGEVECALRRLVGLGLIEELPKPPEGPERAGAARAYRLAEKGRRAVEGIPLEDPRWRLPYEDAEFFARWDVRDLVEYIRVNYPEYVVAARDERVGRPTV